MPWRKDGHNLTLLATQIAALATVAGARIARYLGASTMQITSSAIANWTPMMRYRPATMTGGDAQAWCACARAVFQETVDQMRLDGVL
jgi:hypothetical protein